MVEYVILRISRSNNGTRSFLEFQEAVEAKDPDHAVQKTRKEEVRMEKETYFAIPKSYLHQFDFKPSSNSANKTEETIETLRKISRD